MSNANPTAKKAATKAAKKTKFQSQLEAVRGVLLAAKKGMTIGQIAEKASKKTKNPINAACVSARFRDLRNLDVNIVRETNAKTGEFVYSGTLKTGGNG